MKAAGIDIGTTTISGVVLEKEENGQAKILEAKTVENGCFIETGNEWERIQYAKEIVERAVNLLDYFLEKYPHVERIGLTGQMHGIVYVDKEGNCVSPLYTWQDVRGSICDGDHDSFNRRNPGKMSNPCCFRIWACHTHFIISGIIWFRIRL